MAFVLSGILFAALAGCASGAGGKPSVVSSAASTDSTEGATKSVVAAPSIIYVSDFYLAPEMIAPAPSPAGPRDGPVSRLRQHASALRGEDPAAKAQEIVVTLSECITRDLNKAGYHAEYRPSTAGLRREFFPANADLPREGWLVGGWFEQVREPNRIQEATVGFGSGSGQVSIEVIVSDLADDPHRPFLCIGSENAHHRMPGGLVSMNPYAMAARFVLSRGETERDVKAMGSAIAECLVQYLQRGADTQAPH